MAMEFKFLIKEQFEYEAAIYGFNTVGKNRIAANHELTRHVKRMVQEGQQPLQMLPGTTAEEELQKCHLYATALLEDAPIEDYARVKAKLIHIKLRFERINKDECDQTLHALVTANLQEIEETLRERLNESASVGSQVNEADLMPADPHADTPQGDGQGDIGRRSQITTLLRKLK